MKILYDPHSSCRNLVNDYFKASELALRDEVLNGYRFINGGEKNSNWV